MYYNIFLCFLEDEQNVEPCFGCLGFCIHCKIYIIKNKFKAKYDINTYINVLVIINFLYIFFILFGSMCLGLCIWN